MANLKTNHTFPMSLSFEECQEIKPWKSKIVCFIKICTGESSVPCYFHSILLQWAASVRVKQGIPEVTFFCVCVVMQI